MAKSDTITVPRSEESRGAIGDGGPSTPVNPLFCGESRLASGTVAAMLDVWGGLTSVPVAGTMYEDHSQGGDDRNGREDVPPPGDVPVVDTAETEEDSDPDQEEAYEHSSDLRRSAH